MEDFVLRSSVEYDFLEETIPESMLHAAQEHAENGKTVWIEDVVTGESHSFADFNDETMRVASFLYKHGMRKGDTAIYMSVDIIKTNYFFMGVWRANGTVRASYPEDDAETLLYRVEESRVGWILCDPEHVDLCMEAASQVYWDVEVIVTGESDGCISFQEMFDDDGTECPELVVTPDHPALILCTSGTTGRSKGAVHSHRGFLNTVVVTQMYGPFSRTAPNLAMSKATHITGAMFPLMCLYGGLTILVMPTIKKQYLFEAVDKYKPAFVWGFPTFLLQMVNDPDAENYDFTSVDMIGSGGAQITPAIETALQKLPNLKALVNVYGLTETCPVTMEINYEDPPNKYEDIPPFSTGKVVPGGEVTIRDPETGEVLGPNQRGEICIKTERNFVSYINNPEATENAFIDGYFRTGDIGYFDENEFIFVVDRLKEIFKYYNNHISPTEIEDILQAHEAVTEVCVFGVPDPEGGGYIPRACVTVNSDEVTTEEILNYANEKLVDYKRLRGGLFIVPELPKGKTGKVTRNLVAEMPLPE